MKACPLVTSLMVGVLAGCQAGAPRQFGEVKEPPQTVRCAVIGGMIRTGLWRAVSERFEQKTGHKVETVISGPIRVITPAMQEGEVDLITMHASDAVINLVADGYATEPWPWTRNDLVIVGPPDDPAKIRGMTDAGEALRRIASAKVNFVIHQSNGAQEVLSHILGEEGIAFDPAHVMMQGDHPHELVLEYATEHHAYTLVGRIPFLDGKMPNEKLQLMVAGDARLRRPYVVAIANPQRWPDARSDAARELSRFLRSNETQIWLEQFGRGQLDDGPLFFPIAPQSRQEATGSHTQPAHSGR